MNHELIQKLKEEPTNAMGGNFISGTDGDGLQGGKSKLAGIPSILGMSPGTPVVQQQPFLARRRQTNEEDQERRSKLIAILMRRSLSEQVLPPSATLPKLTDKAISGISGKAAEDLPPGKNIPITNRPATSVNGLDIKQNLNTVYANLQADSERFSKLNIDPDKINNPSYIYKSRNVAGQADRMNTLNGIEMGLFFKPGEVETDSTGNFVSNNPSRVQSSLLNYFNRKQNR
tara:strand:- start:252 stop:944 length:693 start_codon:yes stop_codon:yes gene_type:complete